MDNCAPLQFDHLETATSIENIFLVINAPAAACSRLSHFSFFLSIFQRSLLFNFQKKDSSEFVSLSTIHTASVVASRLFLNFNCSIKSLLLLMQYIILVSLLSGIYIFLVLFYCSIARTTATCKTVLLLFQYCLTHCLITTYCKKKCFYHKKLWDFVA